MGTIEELRLGCILHLRIVKWFWRTRLGLRLAVVFQGLFGVEKDLITFIVVSYPVHVYRVNYGRLYNRPDRHSPTCGILDVHVVTGRLSKTIVRLVQLLGLKSWMFRTDLGRLSMFENCCLQSTGTAW